MQELMPLSTKVLCQHEDECKLLSSYSAVDFGLKPIKDKQTSHKEINNDYQSHSLKLKKKEHILTFQKLAPENNCHFCKLKLLK